MRVQVSIHNVYGDLPPLARSFRPLFSFSLSIRTNSKLSHGAHNHCRHYWLWPINAELSFPRKERKSSLLCGVKSGCRGGPESVSVASELSRTQTSSSLVLNALFLSGRPVIYVVFFEMFLARSCCCTVRFIRIAMIRGARTWHAVIFNRYQISLIMHYCIAYPETVNAPNITTFLFDFSWSQCWILNMSCFCAESHFHIEFWRQCTRCGIIFGKGCLHCWTSHAFRQLQCGRKFHVGTYRKYVWDFVTFVTHDSDSSKDFEYRARNKINCYLLNVYSLTQ